MIPAKIFKAYDIRGVYPEEINEEGYKRIAQAYAKFIQPKKVAVGSDVRISSPSLKKAVVEGLMSMGVDVIDIGTVPTEMLYFAIGTLNLDGGIQVSASHNPAQYNGFIMLRAGVEAISSDNGLYDVRDIALSDQVLQGSEGGKVSEQNLEDDYLAFLESKVNFKDLKDIKIVANSNFGVTGQLAKKFFTKVVPEIELVEINFEPNGHFPKGQPDPLLASNRQEVSEAVKDNQASLAVSWDADGDRCYIADENGLFIEGCHLTAILAQHLLEKNPSEKVIYDPRNIWAVERTVEESGGVPIMSKPGHTFLMNRMKTENALFAGEMSGHFYYRDFFFADNGIMPLIDFLNIMAKTGKKVSEIAQSFREKYFVSGEINFRVTDINKVLSIVAEKYADGHFDQTDGLSVGYDLWRFNLRSSNTEPLLRLNVEAKDLATCQNKTDELKAVIEPFLQD